MPPELLALGPWVVGIYLIIKFAEQTLVPFVTKHVLPNWSKTARDRQAAAAKVEADRLAAEKEQEEERRRREDRLFGIVEANTRAMGGLQSAISSLEGAIEGVNDQLGRQSESIHDQGLDIAGLYGHIQVQRPSAAARRAAAAAKDKPAAGGS